MKIVTVPTPGELALDGTAVLADAVVTKADIDDGKLIFTPVAGASGDPYATFTFKVNDGTVDSADAYTMSIDVNPAITIVADRPTATGKVDWVHYTLRREGDPAAELTVTVTFAGPADNDWSLTLRPRASREVTFAANSATAEQSIQLGRGLLGGIGFSDSATTSGALTARLGAKTGYDTSDTDEVQVVVNSGPAWVIKLADDALPLRRGRRRPGHRGGGDGRLRRHAGAVAGFKQQFRSQVHPRFPRPARRGACSGGLCKPLR